MPGGIDGGGAGRRGLTGGRGTGLGAGGRGKVSLGRLPPVVHPIHAGKAVPVQQVRSQRLFLKVVLNLTNKIPTKYIFIYSTTLCVPSSELGLSHPLSRQRVCPSPGIKGGGGHTRLRARGWRSPNSDDWRKSLAVCLLC